MQSQTIIFGDGFIGRDLAMRLSNAVICDADICNQELVQSTLSKARPDVVINCVGKFGSGNVDWCEKNKKQTYNSNTNGTRVLADACKKLGVYYIHVSSACLYPDFFSTKRYAASDSIGPTNFYTFTKLLAEKAVDRRVSAIVRIRQPVCEYPHPRNLLTKLTGFKYVLDYPNSFTMLENFAKNIKKLMARKETGVFICCEPEPLTLGEIYEELVAAGCNCDQKEKIKVSQAKLVREGLIKSPRTNIVLRSCFADEKDKNSAKQTLRMAANLYVVGHKKGLV